MQYHVDTLLYKRGLVREAVKVIGKIKKLSYWNTYNKQTTKSKQKTNKQKQKQIVFKVINKDLTRFSLNPLQNLATEKNYRNYDFSYLRCRKLKLAR